MLSSDIVPVPAPFLSRSGLGIIISRLGRGLFRLHHSHSASEYPRGPYKGCSILCTVFRSDDDGTCKVRCLRLCCISNRKRLKSSSGLLPAANAPSCDFPCARCCFSLVSSLFVE